MHASQGVGPESPHFRSNLLDLADPGRGDEHRRRDHVAPPGRLPVHGIVIQRIAVPVALGEVTDGVQGSVLVERPLPGRHYTDAFPKSGDAFIGDLGRRFAGLVVGTVTHRIASPHAWAC